MIRFLPGAIVATSRDRLGVVVGGDDERGLLLVRFLVRTRTLHLAPARTHPADRAVLFVRLEPRKQAHLRGRYLQTVAFASRLFPAVKY